MRENGSTNVQGTTNTLGDRQKTELLRNSRVKTHRSVDGGGNARKRENKIYPGGRGPRCRRHSRNAQRPVPATFSGRGDFPSVVDRRNEEDAARSKAKLAAEVKRDARFFAEMILRGEMTLREARADLLITDGQKKNVRDLECWLDHQEKQRTETWRELL